MEKETTNKTVLEVLKRIRASGKMPMVVDLVDEFDCAAAPKPILDALRFLKDAGLVDFKEPLFSDSAIKIIDVTEQRTLKTAIKRTEYRVIRKEYEDGSIIEYWFPGDKIGHERRVIRPPGNPRKEARSKGSQTVKKVKKD